MKHAFAHKDIIYICDIPEGYFILDKGERVIKGDLYFNTEFREFQTSHNWTIGEGVQSEWIPYIRKI